MKIRKGFVSNSSSSSFIIATKNLNDTQLFLIENHGKLELPYAHQFWKIEIIDGDILRGSTCMNNFNMKKFLVEIGVDQSKMVWDGNDAQENYYNDSY